MGINLFKRLMGLGEDPVVTACGPPGKRAYAIGDVHGCDALLGGLLEQIAAEERRLPPCDETYIVLLGDLIDRGPHSAQVIERLRTTDWGHVTPVFVMGNHEEMMLRVLADDLNLVDDWLYHGGRQCAQSYGLEMDAMPPMAAGEVAYRLRRAVPQAHLDFLATFVHSFRFGDYLFVHAGIRPGVPIDQQMLQDLHWIRDGFLNVWRDDGLVVVHGHTIVDKPVVRSGRIGIDTGAFDGGSLTAVRIEDQTIAFLRQV